ncbi:MAG: response regulator transcription factor [Cellulomonas sp.]
MIRVSITDDHRLFRDALAELLSQEETIDVVGTTESGVELLRLAATTPPHVALIDMDMPGRDGIATTLELRRVAPETRVIILTMFTASGHVQRALDAGAEGFMTKNADIEELVGAIRRVHSGRRVVDPSLVADVLLGAANPLSDRERDVLRLVLEGRSTQEMAAALFLTPGTIKNYCSSAMQKTGACSRFQAGQMARDRGWL